MKQIWIFLSGFLVLTLTTSCIEDPATFLPGSPEVPDHDSEGDSDIYPDGDGDPLVCESPFRRCQQANTAPVCADVEVDELHCGQCNRRCPESTDGSPLVCLEGQCSYLCAAGETACLRSCADLMTDPQSCGECGRVCRSGNCAEGQCQPFSCDPNGAPFGGGTGTVSNPFVICTAAQFLEIGAQEDRFSDHFVLSASIDLAGQVLEPIGSFEAPFEGSFEGFDFSITGVEFNDTNSATLGLFGVVGENGELSDFQLSATLAGGSTAGLLAGNNAGILRDIEVQGVLELSGEIGGLVVGQNSGTLLNIIAEGTISGGSTLGGVLGVNQSSGQVENLSALVNVESAGSTIGGLVGIQRGVIRNAQVSGEVRGGDSTGGLAGRMEGSALTRNSQVTTHVTGEGLYTGGLVGSLGETAEIVDSIASGRVDAFSGNFVGGLVGRVSDSTEIRRCSALGDVYSDRDFVGGLIGLLDGESKVFDSFATGSVDAGGGSNVGGLIGAMAGEAQLSRSYARGNVVSGKGPLGGLVGALSDQALVNRSYATGEARSEDESLGGLIGEMRNGSSVTASLSSGPVIQENSSRGTGGLVGRLFDESKIQNSASHSNVLSQGRYAGGLVGEADGAYEIRRSFATGSVQGDHSVGGLIGRSRSNGTIRDVYAMGAVTADDDRAGGLIGNFDGDLRFAYSTGTVSSDDPRGGLFGRVSGGEIRDTLWDRDSSGINSDPSEMSSASTPQFGAAATFPGWDFSQVWQFSTTMPRRPILRLQLPVISSESEDSAQD